MQSIKTKFLKPTDTQGPKIRAVSSGGRSGLWCDQGFPRTSHTEAYDYTKKQNENHASAAVSLARKLNWRGTLIEGEGFSAGERVFLLYDGDAHEYPNRFYEIDKSPKNG